MHKMKLTGPSWGCVGLRGAPQSHALSKVPGKKRTHNKCVRSCCCLVLLWFLQKGNSPFRDDEVP